MALIRTDVGLDDTFRFPNSFELSFGLSLPFLPARKTGPMIYGLCGGMCYAALDYKLAGVTIPTQTAVPEPRTALRRYLWERQLRSMLWPLIVPKTIAWMFRSDRYVARRTEMEELPKVRGRLDRGHPVALVLVRVGKWENPTYNHQVVVVGYAHDDVTGLLDLFLYDPNHPGSEPTLTIRSLGGREGVALEQSTGEPVRGFFALTYAPRTRGLPPALEVA